MIIERFSLNLNMIMTFVFSFDIVIKKLEKFNLNGKKELESLLNNIQELNLFKKTEGANNNNCFSLFKNIDNFSNAVIEIEIYSILKKFNEMMDKIEVLVIAFEKNHEFLLDSFKKVLGDKNQEINFDLLQKNLALDLDLKRKDIRRFFLFMKILSISSKIKESFRKDKGLKNKILAGFENKIKVMIENKDAFLDNYNNLKYYLQLWIFRPYIDEKFIDIFYVYLKEFTKNYYFFMIFFLIYFDCNFKYFHFIRLAFFL